MKITNYSLTAPENTTVGSATSIAGVTISGSASSNYRIAAVTSNTAVWVPPDAVSYASNTTDVSSTAAAGASTLVSRADHVHRGVRSVSHSSNTFYGDITLQTEGSAYIVSPAAGTLKIGATAGSGGGGAGGSGAPTDAEYLVTAADADLSAERVVDLGRTTLLKEDAAANAEDDHFDATSLNAKWTALTNNAPTLDHTASPGWVQFAGSGRIYQAVPAGDWTIETELIHGSQTSAGFTDVGLWLGSSTNWNSGTFALWGVGKNNSLTDWRYVFEKFVNGSFSSAYGTETGLPIVLQHHFLRIVKSGTNYHAEASVTGRTWQRLFSTSALGFTPTHFGIGAIGGAANLFNYFLRY